MKLILFYNKHTSNYLNIKKMCIICSGDYDNSLTELDCNYCQEITEIPGTLINLTYLNCSFTKIIEISNTLINLTYLDCSFTKINIIPDTLVNLDGLDCDNTKIKKIPGTLINLTELDCYINQIKKIPNTLINLTKLVCYKTHITEIPNTLINLEFIMCSDTQIKKIPDTLINLQCLFCFNTQIKIIPGTLINLTILNNTGDCDLDNESDESDEDNIVINQFTESNSLILERLNKYKCSIIQFQRIFRRNKRFIILWKIAEYYTSVKYSPKNIIKNNLISFD